MKGDYLISVRGYFENPTLILLNGESKEIKSKIAFPTLRDDNIPRNKRGFAGILKKDDYVYVATWNKISVLSLKDFHIIEEFYSPRFNDIHGFDVEDGKIYLANTNLESVDCIDTNSKEISLLWSPCDIHNSYSNNLNFDQYLEKTNSPFHYFHLNSVTRLNEYFFVSYLGPSKPKRLKKLREFFGIYRYRHGGIFILDQNLKAIKQIKTEGLHDPFFINDQLLGFTQYFKNSLILFDTKKFKKKHIKLQIPEEYETKFLTRGGLVENKSFIIGHTLKRGWETKSPYSLIREYDLNGKDLNNEIKLSNVVGIYDIIKI